MSVAAVSWAIAQNIKQPSVKLVLVTLAHWANKDNWTAFREKSELVKDTSLSLKTVKAALRQLREEGYLEDSGERRGATNQIVVFRLCTERGEETTPVTGIERGEDVTPVTKTKGGKSGHERGVIQGMKGGQFRDPPIEEPKEPKEPYDDDDVRAVAEKFFELRKVHWPDREPCLTPRLTLETEARQFLNAGGTPELAIQHLEAQMAKVAARGRSPPSSLKFFRDSLGDELARSREVITFPSRPNGAARHEPETAEQRRQRIIEMARNGN